MLTLDLAAMLSFVAIIAALIAPLILYAIRSPDPVDDVVAAFYIGGTIIGLALVALLAKWLLGDDGIFVVVLAWAWMCVYGWLAGTEERENRCVVQANRGQR